MSADRRTPDRVSITDEARSILAMDLELRRATWICNEYRRGRMRAEEASRRLLKHAEKATEASFGRLS